MQKHIRSLRRSTVDRLHDVLVRRSRAYASWHDSLHAEHVHWIIFFAFTLGWAMAILSVVATLLFLPTYHSFALTGQNLSQIHTRWRNDDGDETTATFAAAEDAAISALAKQTTKRLRFAVSNEGSAASDATRYRLQYALRNTTCAAITEGSWASVPTVVTDAQHFQMVDSANLTNGNPTTNIASGLTDENTTFVAGAVHDTANETGNITLTATQFTELEYAIAATTNATSAGTYCFRFIDTNGLPLRTNALTLSAGENNLLSAVSDTTNGFVYFGTNTSPGRVIKVRLSDFTRVDALTLSAGEDILEYGSIDTTNGFAYFVTRTSPGRIVKIRLSDFTRVDALTLATGENNLYASVIDTANGFLYAPTYTSPAGVVKIRLSDFTRVGALTLSAGEDNIISAGIDTTNGFAYFSTNTVPGRVIKVRLSDFTRVGALTLNAGEDFLEATAIDAPAGFAYVGVVNAPARVVKIRLSDMTRVDAITMNAGEEYFVSVAIDTTDGFAYFGTGAVGRLVKIRLSDFTRVGTLAFNDGESASYAALLDASSGFGYFGTSDTPAKIVKADLRHLLDTYTAYAQATLIGSGAAEARGDETPPAVPSSFTVTATDNGKALLTWTDPPDTDLKDITVLRGVGNIPVSGDPYAIVVKGVGQYTDANVIKGEKYTFRLKAADTAGNFSLSAEKSVTIPLPSPPPAVSPSPASPSGVIKTAPPSPPSFSSSVNVRRLVVTRHPAKVVAPQKKSADPCVTTYYCSNDQRFLVQRIDTLKAPTIDVPPTKTKRSFAKLAGTTIQRATETGTETYRVVRSLGKTYNFFDPTLIEGALLSTPTTIIVKYDAKIARLLLRSGQTLALVRRDPVENTWSILSSATQNANAGTFTVTTAAQGNYTIVILVAQ